MPRRKSDPTEGEAVTPKFGRTETDGQPEGEPEAAGKSRPASEAAPRTPVAAPDEPAEFSPATRPKRPAANRCPRPVPSSEVPELRPEPIEAILAPTTTVDEPAPEADDGQEAHEEEAGRSFAGRALTLLLLLLAGAALGIWGAPKLAPLLPSGLAPVADWLTPGAQRGRGARSPTLRGAARRGARRGRGAPRRPRRQAATSTRGSQRRSTPRETRLAGEIAALQQTRRAARTAPTRRQRLARLESALEGQAAELAALKEQLSGAAAASGQLSEEAVAEDRRLSRRARRACAPRWARCRTRSAGLGRAGRRGRGRTPTARSRRRRRRSARSRPRPTPPLGAAETDADLALIRAAIAERPAVRGAAGGARRRSRASRCREGLTRGGAERRARRWRSCATASPTPRTRRSAPASWPAPATGCSPAVARLPRGAGRQPVADAAGRAWRPTRCCRAWRTGCASDDLDGRARRGGGSCRREAAAAMGGWLDAARLRAGAVDGLAALDAALPATN